MFTSTCHLQTNGQVERCNRTIFSALRYYVAECLRNWDLFGDALTFGYNAQTYPSARYARFELMLSRAPETVAMQRLWKVNGEHFGELSFIFLTQLRDMMSTATENLRKYQERYERKFGTSVRVRRLPDVNSNVHLRRNFYRNARITPGEKASRELRRKTSGPF